MIKLGTSGFSYPDWKGTVYPKKLKQAEMLEYYEQELGFNCCELNFSYYRLPDPYTLDRMSRRASEDCQSAQNAAQLRELLGIRFQKRTPKLF